jgi:hypothetical protein
MTSMVIQAIILGRRNNRTKGAIHEGAERSVETRPGERQTANPNGVGILFPKAWQGVSPVVCVI